MRGRGTGLREEGGGRREDTLGGAGVLAWSRRGEVHAVGSMVRRGTGRCAWAAVFSGHDTHCLSRYLRLWAYVCVERFLNWAHAPCPCTGQRAARCACSFVCGARAAPAG